ncbi:hypothetical protein A1O1_01050 [Capronia coronata CBS 617.96]|uniref:Major facilitator superfamily (MFS) profile domain-containing protein n=1 Tax=Capronia coronata CBS 617.96 TaxID=1182541 RepID=W9Z1W4_9EURO|nr:uncharacterized protein A1O1_01050 [Capronia coronata CBS 617.96]EXJ95925.1 hypothetical protein A1O1_01050 [Capronia coronata CBS 617.96]
MRSSDEEVHQTVVESISVNAAAALDVPIEEKGSVPSAPSATIDGGVRAWLQVLGCWLVFFNVWGFTFSFGPFQSYYEINLMTNLSSSDVSWIGTVASYLLIVTGVLSGPWFDLGYYKVMLFGGATMSCFGLFMLSLSHQYYQILLTQGICMGLGCGLLYIPGLALVGRSFTRRRAMAMGIVTTGAPIGGIIYTITFDQAIESIGFAWTVRVMGFIMLGSYIIAFPLLLWGTANTGDIASGTPRKLLDKAAFKDMAFWMYTWANFFLFCGYLVPFFYIPTYAQLELNMSRSLSLYSIVIAQGVSVIGRLIASGAALRFGVMVPWLTCGTLSAVLCLAWIGVHTPTAFLAFAGLYGGFSGALIPLPPSIFPVVCPDPKVLGARLGMAQAIGATASLIGSPIAGALVGLGGHGYLGMQLWSGLVMLVGACLLLGLWIMLVKRRGCKTFI